MSAASIRLVHQNKESDGRISVAVHGAENSLEGERRIE